MLLAPNSLETRKQNYIIIITSLSGSSMLFRFLQKIFFNKMLKTMLKVCWNCWKLKNYCRKYYNTISHIIHVNHIYIIRKYYLTYIIPIQHPQKYFNILMQINYTISHIPYHNILYHTPKNPTKTTTNCTA